MSEPDFAVKIREAYHLDPHEEAILQQAVAAYGRLEQITEALGSQPLVIEGRANSRVANPLIAAERATRASFVALLRALRLPEERAS